jgi:hypothetical protein
MNLAQAVNLDDPMTIDYQRASAGDGSPPPGYAAGVRGVVTHLRRKERMTPSRTGSIKGTLRAEGQETMAALRALGAEWRWVKEMALRARLRQAPKKVLSVRLWHLCQQGRLRRRGMKGALEYRIVTA